MDKKEKILNRIIITGFITLGYIIVWMLLELLIDGQIRDSTVDNIIMGLFIPVIYIATKTCEDKNDFSSSN